MNLLEVKQLEKSFGGVTAIAGLSFNVPKGVVYSVIGPNGAGKTTLFNMLCGFYIPDNGSIHLDSGQPNSLPVCLQNMPTDQIAQCGISRTFQNLQIFYNMSVLENVLVGCHLQSSIGFLPALFRLASVQKEEQLVRQNAYQALEFCQLEKLADVSADSLPYGDLKRLEIARALASKPQLLMLDEPAAGLNDSETRDLSKLIRKICDLGITVLLVEHNMKLVMQSSDQIMVLNFGSLLAQGSPQEIQNDPVVIQAYLGGEL
ncbi:MAG: ABC transporter ATP-binding protein [Pseudomonadota bacterium]